MRRIIQLGQQVLIYLVLYLLFGLPSDVAKDMYIHPIAEQVREWTGFEMPRLENIISYVSFMLPLLAAISTVYLYHQLYVKRLIRNIENQISICERCF
jgi:hypothetical protein